MSHVTPHSVVSLQPPSSISIQKSAGVSQLKNVSERILTSLSSFHLLRCSNNSWGCSQNTETTPAFPCC